jgi:hypothetical protein
VTVEPRVLARLEPFLSSPAGQQKRAEVWASAVT